MKVIKSLKSEINVKKYYINMLNCCCAKEKTQNVFHYIVGSQLWYCDFLL